MGFVFISYLYTLDLSGSNNKSPSKDIIIIRKDNDEGFETEDGEVISRNPEGKLLIHVSFPEKERPAEVRHHYKSMTSGEVRLNRLISRRMEGRGVRMREGDNGARQLPVEGQTGWSEAALQVYDIWRGEA